MENPYKILGVSETATDEQIKSAYRKLCKKHHPDLCRDDTSRAQAEDKMAQINAAYDEILEIRRSGGSSSSYAESYNNSYSDSYSDSYNESYNERTYSTQFADVRRLINQKRIARAEQLLDEVPLEQRNAEWHYLRGRVLYARGWFNDAFMHFEKAVEMDPYSTEFAAAYNQANARRNGMHRRWFWNSNSQSECDVCDAFAALLCLDCCCEETGGDCLPC